MFNWKSSAGFTLWECLLSLIVLCMLVQAMTFCFQTYHQITQLQQHDYQLEWYNFTLLFEQELTSVQLDTVRDHHIVWHTTLPNHQVKTSAISLNNGRLVKSPGFQPYLYHVADWYASYQAPILQLDVRFTNGQQFKAYFVLKQQQEEDS